jgi:hypothetical protein
MTLFQLQRLYNRTSWEDFHKYGVHKGLEAGDSTLFKVFYYPDIRLERMAEPRKP